MKNDYHRANRNRWEASAENWAKGSDSRGIWRRCPTEPSLVLSPVELEYLSDVNGKRVCVLGSGDNQVVFSLAGLGASVTSVDIAQGQLDVGSRRAQELGLSVSFVRADVTDLAEFTDGHFDIVYTGGHVAVWVSDLKQFYSEAARILRLGGYLIVAEYHPFRRIWKGSSERLEVDVSYYARGPFAFDSNDKILRSEPGNFRSGQGPFSVETVTGSGECVSPSSGAV